MKRGEVDLLGGDELIVGLLADIVDVVDNERIAELVLGEKDYLCTTGGQPTHNCLSHPTGATLGMVSVHDRDM